MADKHVRVVLEALTDQYKAKMREATASTRSFAKSLLEGQASLGKLAGGFGLAFGAVEVGRRVLSFVGDTIDAASDLNESMNKTTVVFGESADQIVAWSETSAESMGISQRAALESAGTFGNLFTAMGLTVGAAADMSTSMIQLASDLASFNNASPEEVLKALQSGIVGEVEPLRRFGIEVSDAALKQEALAQGIDKSTQEMSQAEKVQLRYAIIMKQSSNAQGDFARTSDELANSQRTLEAKFEDLKASLGQDLLPAVLEFVGTAEDLIDVIGPGLEFVFSAAGDAARTFGENVETAIGPLEYLLGLLPGAGRSAEEGTSMLERLIHAGQEIASPFNINPITKYRNVWDDLTDAEGRAAAEAEDAARAFRPLIYAIRSGDPAFVAMRDRFLEVGDGFLRLSDHAADAQEAIAHARGILSSFIGPIAAVADEISVLDQRLRDAARSLRTYRQLQLALVDPVFGVIEAVRADQEAEEALAAARAKLDRLTERGKEGTKAYAEAQRDVQDKALAAAEAHALLLGQVEAMTEAVREGEVKQRDAVAALRAMASAQELTKGETKLLVAQLRAGIRELERWNSTPLQDKTAAIRINVFQSRVGIGPEMHSGGLASDEIPAILQRGEYVIRARAASRIGRPALDALNRLHAGGPVPGMDPMGRMTGGLGVSSSMLDRLFSRLERQLEKAAEDLKGAQARAARDLGRDMTQAQRRLERRIEEARDHLAEIRSRMTEFTDAIREGFTSGAELLGGLRDRFGELTAEGEAGFTSADAQAFLAEILAQNRSFADALTTLSEMGLDTGLLAELASGGPEDLPFLQALIAGGPDLVAALNSTQAAIDAIAGQTADELGMQRFGAELERAREHLANLGDRVERVTERFGRLLEALGGGRPNRPASGDRAEVVAAARAAVGVAAAAGPTVHNNVTVNLKGPTIARSEQELANAIVRKMDEALAREGRVSILAHHR